MLFGSGGLRRAKEELLPEGQVCRKTTQAEMKTEVWSTDKPSALKVAQSECGF